MRELEFKRWLIKNGTNKKVHFDMVSRLKRIERELDYIDIDQEYQKDSCKSLLNLFGKKQSREALEKYPKSNLPFGEYQIAAYKLSLKKYITFLQDTN